MSISQCYSCTHSDVDGGLRQEIMRRGEDHGESDIGRRIGGGEGLVKTFLTVPCISSTHAMRSWRAVHYTGPEGIERE